MKGIEGEKTLSPPEATGRAVEKYLAVLDYAAFGAATEVTPEFVSPVYRQRAGPLPMAGRPSLPTSTNYLIDVENAIIVDVEATTAIRQAEVSAAKRMIERSIPASISARPRSWATAPMARPRCSAGSFISTASNRM